MNFKQIEASQIENPIALIDKGAFLITAGGPNSLNTMTGGWYNIGRTWNKQTVTAFVRPSRHTFKFTEQNETMSLCFFDQSFKEKLVYCGKISGRDEDKIAKCGFTVAYELDTPYFEEASLVIIAKKLYAQYLDPALFIDKSIIDKAYAGGDLHQVYTCEILKVLAK